MKHLMTPAAAAVLALAAAPATAATYLTSYAAGTSGRFTAQYAGIYALTAAGGAGGDSGVTITGYGGLGDVTATRLRFDLGQAVQVAVGSNGIAGAPGFFSGGGGGGRRTFSILPAIR